MALQLIDVTPGAGDSAPVGGAKINANFTELYGATDELSAYVDLTVEARGLIREVWIAFGTPGDDGIGTSEHPFRVETAAQFDSLLRSFAAEEFITSSVVDPIIIHLGPGTFLTMGGAFSETAFVEWDGSPQYLENTSGFHLFQNWQLIGSGRGVTILKQFAWPTYLGNPWPAGNKHVVVQSPSGATGYRGDGIRLAHLTVDCNWDAMGGTKPENTAMAGVNLYGSRIRIEDVEVKNFYGDLASGQECFALAIVSTDYNSYFPDVLGFPDFTDPVEGCSISGCYVHSPVASSDYVVGIALFGVANGVGGTRLYGRGNLVADNYVTGITGGTSAYQVAGRGLIFSRNTSLDCYAGLHVDTAPAQDVQVYGNEFLGTLVRGISIRGGAGAEHRRWSIFANTIEVLTSANSPVCVGIDTAASYDISFFCNTFRETGTTAASPRYGFNVELIQGLTLIANQFASTLTNTIAGSVTPRFFRDNKVIATLATPTNIADTALVIGIATGTSLSLTANLTAAGVYVSPATGLYLGSETYIIDEPTIGLSFYSSGDEFSTYGRATIEPSGALNWLDDGSGFGAAQVTAAKLATRTNMAVPAVQVKATTGDPSAPTSDEPTLCINTFDNNLKIYADAAWRQIITW